MKKIVLIVVVCFCSLNILHAQLANKPGSGECLNFNGLSDYIELSSDYQVALPTTVNFWFKLDNLAAQVPLFSSDSWGGGNYYGIYAHISSTNIAMGYGDGGPSGSSTNRRSKSANYNWDLNVWYHVAVVYKGALDMSIYVNGIDVGGNYSGSGGNLTNSSNTPRIGNNYSSTWYLDGNFDEFSLWNKVLTQTEIRNLMCQKLTGTENNLQIYYRMDEGIDNSCPGGEDVCDATGNGNNGAKF